MQQYNDFRPGAVLCARQLLLRLLLRVVDFPGTPDELKLIEKSLPWDSTNISWACRSPQGNISLSQISQTLREASVLACDLLHSRAANEHQRS